MENVKLNPEKALNDIIESIIKNSQNPVLQLSNYIISGDPIYLPEEIRKIEHQIDRNELIDVISEILLNKHRSKNK